MKKFQKWLLTITLKRLVNKAERKIKNVYKSVKKFCGFVILNISMDLADKKGECCCRKPAKKMQKNKRVEYGSWSDLPAGKGGFNG